MTLTSTCRKAKELANMIPTIHILKRTAKPEPAPVQTIIGRTVTALDAAYQTAAKDKEFLERTIARLSEDLRQTNASLDALNAALRSCGDDPALTVEEKDIAGAALGTSF